jgi:CheY-like chemotaxis protein
MENAEVVINKSETEQYSWNNKTILVAEDIDLNYLYIIELLKPTGAKIIRAENGKIALDYCRNNHIDIVLMDLLMPVMNGYEATRQIKAMNSFLPIIAQTAYTMSDDRRKAKEAGCDDFIAKPIDKEELLKKIGKHFIFS